MNSTNTIFYTFNAYICKITRIHSFLSTDIDECAISTHNCHSLATCVNTQDGFDCICNPGYGGDGVTCAGRTTFIGLSDFSETFYPCSDELEG